ncbi:hypothetical protein CEXT_748091 [Caerostris extrusa]|uniref:Secreted protein n=1 Tax=Caerostris extrusa TaxID=172846 RepID=A0AAV4QPE3_CAEEX|nr:hypothetical protein CEXT_748091 [Caerostris extrusa]
MGAFLAIRRTQALTNSPSEANTFFFFLFFCCTRRTPSSRRPIPTTPSSGGCGGGRPSPRRGRGGFAGMCHPCASSIREGGLKRRRLMNE